MLTAVLAHCPLCFTWTNWSSKLFLGCCSQSLISICERTYAARTLRLWRHCLAVFPHFQWNSSATAMRFLAAFLVCLYGVGSIGCKPSSQCPSGQFLLKNQCVLCHPTCSECNGHELFECTTCGVGEKDFLPVLSSTASNWFIFFKGKRRIIYVSNLIFFVTLRFSRCLTSNVLYSLP